MSNTPAPVFRPYAPTDQQDCLAIFDSNTPQFFGVDERPDFFGFLSRQPCPYYVVERDGKIVASGGNYTRVNDGDAFLVWGMVHKDHHRQGIGTLLLQERLKLIFLHEPGARVVIDTSQHSQAFFARFGFQAKSLTENHYAPGLHRVDMELFASPELLHSLQA